MDRKDGLPQPTLVGETYLLAVLDELRDINATLKQLLAHPEPDPNQLDLLKVKET